MNSSQSLSSTTAIHPQGISSFHDLIVPMLSLSEQVQYIFSSSGDRGSKWDQVWIAFQAKSIQIIENLSSQNKDLAEETLKKIHTTALALLGKDTPTSWEIEELIEDMCEFDAVFDKKHTPFLERFGDLQCFWNKSPSGRLMWIQILLKRGFFFQASRILTKLQPQDKPPAQLMIAIDLVNRGEVDEAVDLLLEIDDKELQLKGYEAIAISYLNQGKYSKILPFIEDLRESHSDQYGFWKVLKNVEKRLLNHNKLNLALEIANTLKNLSSREGASFTERLSLEEGVLQSLPPLSDDLTEAFEAGRYAKAIVLMQKKSSSLDEQKNWFRAFVFFLRSSKGEVAAANCLDCIPTGWDDKGIILDELIKKMNFGYL